MNDQTFAPAPASAAQTPVELKGTKQRDRYKVAARLKAVEETVEYGLRQTGMINTLRTVHKLNQTDGFDCQSCAWPNPDGERSIAEFCENGFKAVTYEATTKRLDRAFFKEHSVKDLAAMSDHSLGHTGRITEPMVLRAGATHYEPIAWEAAFEMIAEELKRVDSPHEAVFYTSGRTSNETAFLYQLFARVFGTNNLPDCSNMCHEFTSVALPPMIGIGKACVKLSDFDKADAIFIIGQNPGTNHPRMLTPLQQAKERGCKIVIVNPLPEAGSFRFKNPQDLMHPLKIPRFFLGKGTKMSDLWLPVTINGDMAFLQGLMKEMLEAEDRKPGTVFDHEFIRHHTEGYDALRKCRLTAHVSIKLNRSHVITGETALILPCLGRSEVDKQAGGEQFMTVEDTMGVISPTRGNLKPASKKLLSEVAIVAGLAKAVLGETRPIDWDAYVANYDLIRNKIEAVIPGFLAFNQRIREGTFYLPNPPRDERVFPTESRKAHFIAHPLSRAEIEPGQFLTTVRSHDQFNTSIYGLDDRYRAIYNGRRVVFMNEEDMRDLGLVQGHLVDLTSHFKGEQRQVERFMVAPYEIQRRCTAAYYPETNALVPHGSAAEKSNCPTSKSICITIAVSADQSTDDWMEIK